MLVNTLVLSNNCSTSHWVRQNLHSSHCVDQKQTHSWTRLERNLTSPQQSLKHHEPSPWSVTCGVLLLWDVLCLTHLCAPSIRQSTHTLSRFSDLGCSTALQRWAASADSTRCTCSRPHDKPASFPRLLLLPEHSPRMWRSNKSFSPFQSSCHSLACSQSPRHSHWLFVPVHR